MTTNSTFGLTARPRPESGSRIGTPRRRRDLCIPVLFVAAAFAAPAVAHNPPQSAVEDIFAPDDYATLSNFSTVDGQGVVYMLVNPDILGWLVQHSATMKVAHRVEVSAGVFSIEYHDPDQPIQASSGQVTLTVSSLSGHDDEGSYVFVSNSFRHDFLPGDSPILTHWSWDTSDHRGQQLEGANDYVVIAESIGLDEFGNEKILTTYDYPAFDPDNPIESLCLETPSPTVPVKKFNTTQIALFSDGTTASRAATVPGYERYVSENWTHGISAFIVAWRSDRVHARTGLPILCRNGAAAFDLGSTDPVLVDVPLIQIVNAILVQPAGNPSIPGNEHSLISIVLPPGWVPAADPLPDPPPYPILLLSYYDLNHTVFSHASNHVFDAIGALNGPVYGHDGGYVGVIWNGGGAGACQTKQRSSHDNALELLELTRDLAGGDPMRVVMTGGSRGGTAALSIASNPYHKDEYRVRYVVAETPVVDLSAMGSEFGNVTYPLAQSTMQDLTGYCNGWYPEWVVPDTGGLPTSDVCNIVLYGTKNLTTIYDRLSNTSDTFIESISDVDDGVEGVVLRVGTHDMSKPFSMSVDYYEQLVAAGMEDKVRFEISYRFGHTYAVDVPGMPDEALFMDHLIDGGMTTFPSGVFHYKRVSETLVQEGEEFDPTHQPLVFEGPIQVGHEQEASYTFIGAPGTEYEVEYRYYSVQTGGPGGQYYPLVSGVLPSTGTDFSSATHKLELTNTSGATKVIVHYLTYTVPGEDPVTLLQTGIAPPGMPYSGTFLFPSSQTPYVGAVIKSRTSGFSTELEALP